MVGDERTRHCAECNLNVHNLSAMSAEQVRTLVVASQVSGSRLCGRFYRRADGTVITQDCPRGLRAATRRMTKVAAAVLTALMSVNFAAAKSKNQSCSIKSTNTQKQPGLWLQIMDQQGAVLPDAQVQLMEEVGQKTVSGSTDASGALSLTKLPPGDYVLTVSARGFRTFKRSLTLKDNWALEVKLKLAIAQAKTNVEVKADIKAEESVTVGILIATTEDQDVGNAPAGRSQPTLLRSK